MEIIGGRASSVLSYRIAKELGCKVIPTEFKRFPDGEMYTRIMGDIGREVTIIQSTPTDTDLICLLQLIDACDRAETTVVIPYFGYARQDKCFKSGEAVSARMIARMIHADRVCTVNIHNRDVLKYFDLECRDLDATPLIADHIKSTGLEDPMIIAPDEGALELIRSVAGTEFDHDMLKKKRISGEEVEIEEKEIDVKDRDVIILDDIISTGGTIVETVELLKRQKLRSIYVCCIHPVFAGNAEIKLFNAGVNEIFATDTIEHIFSKISVAPIIAMELG